MKHYKEQFFVTEKINKNTAIKLKPSYFEKAPYDKEWIKYHPKEWAEQQQFMLDSYYDVETSGIFIRENGIERYWNLKNLDKNRFPEERRYAIDANWVYEDCIDDSDYPFTQDFFEFDAPEIGEHFYFWCDGHVYDVVLSCINIELDPCFEHGYGWHFINLIFKDAKGGENRCHLQAEGDDFKKEILDLISKYCRKSPEEFDNDFWSAKYEELRKQKDAEYDELSKEFQDYREWY